MKIFPSFISNLFSKRASYHPGDLEKFLIGNQRDPSSVYLSKEAAMRVSSVFACVRILSNAVAYMPVPFYFKGTDGARTKDETSTLFRMFKFKPNRYQNSFEFRESAMVSLLMRGNFYAEKIYNGKLDIVELYPLDADRMQPFFTGDEQPRYRYQLPNGKEKIFNPEALLHIKALGTHPLIGMSVLEQAANTTGFAAAQIDHGRKFFTNQVRPSGILETAGVLNKPARENLAESWNEYSRSQLGKVAVLENGVKFTPISMTMEQAQFVETTEATVSDIARWFGVPPHLVGDLRRATFSNIEQQSLEFMKYHLDPTWLERWQMAINTQLIPQDEWGNHYCEFLTDKLLRTDTLTRYQTYQIGRQNGWLNADEIRAKENMDPLPDEQGQQYVTALNLGAAQVGNQSTDTEDDTTTEGDDTGGSVSRSVVKGKNADVAVNLYLQRAKSRTSIIKWEAPSENGRNGTSIHTTDD